MSRVLLIELAPDSVGQVLLSKCLPLVLSGILLATLNHLYWESSKTAERERVRVEKKVETFSEVQSILTVLLARVSSAKRTTAHLQSLDTYSDTHATTLAELTSLKKEIAKELGSAASSYAKLHLYFDKPVREKAAAVSGSFAKMDLEETEKIDDEDLWVKINDLSHAMREDLRADLGK